MLSIKLRTVKLSGTDISNSSNPCGFEIEYESFRKEKIIQGILFRVLEKDSRFVHLFAVGHNRVWKKIK